MILARCGNPEDSGKICAFLWAKFPDYAGEIRQVPEGKLCYIVVWNNPKWMFPIAEASQGIRNAARWVAEFIEWQKQQ